MSVSTVSLVKTYAYPTVKERGEISFFYSCDGGRTYRRVLSGLTRKRFTRHLANFRDQIPDTTPDLDDTGYLRRRGHEVWRWEIESADAPVGLDRVRLAA